MQSAGSVLCLVAVACACLLSLASSSAQSGAAQPPRPRHTLFDLFRRRISNVNFPPPPLYSQIQQSQQQYNHQEGRPYLPSSPEQQQEQEQPIPFHHHNPFSLTQRQSQQPSFDLTPIRPRHALPEFAVPRESNQVLNGDDRATWNKRSSGNSSLVEPEEIKGEELLNSLTPVGASLATNFLRHARSSARPYDVPQIGKKKRPFQIFINKINYLELPLKRNKMHTTFLIHYHFFLLKKYSYRQEGRLNMYK